MTQQNKSFLADIRQKLFEWILESEIYGRIFPHLEKERDFGYPFSSDQELQRQVRQEFSDLQSELRTIEEAGRAMPKAYGEAFRFIAYRDIHARIARYRRLARRRVQPKCYDARFVATRA